MNEIITAAPTPFDATERANLQPSTKLKYKRELEAMQQAGINPANHADLQRYAATLKSSRKQFLKSALRLMYADIELNMKANVTLESLPQIQVNLLKLDAMHNTIQTESHKGTKVHLWLSAAQVTKLMDQCGTDIEGQRDWVCLALMVGAGLRRDEAVHLRFDGLKTIPGKNGKMRDVLEVTHAKGDKPRVVPINEKLGARLRAWREVCGGGLIARSLTKGKELGESLSAQALFEICRKYGAKISIPELACHDLRRTYAQLAYINGVSLTQISTCLGHSSIQTTQRYLDLTIDTEVTPSDYVPL